MKERIREIVDRLCGPRLSPKERQELLEKGAEELELRAEWLEKEAVTRKRMAAAELRIRKVGGGRAGGGQKWFLLMLVVIVALVILISQSC